MQSKNNEDSTDDTGNQREHKSTYMAPISKTYEIKNE